jgi:hypothetical protein
MNIETKPPEVKILAVSNVYCRLMNFKSKGDTELGHYHSYDHGTLLASGRLLVEILDDDNNIVSSKQYDAPTFIFIKKDKIHKLTALEDNTVATCIHALRTIDEEIIDSDFLVEERILADSPKEVETFKPTISTVLAEKGMTYKPLATAK